MVRVPHGYVDEEVVVASHVVERNHLVELGGVGGGAGEVGTRLLEPAGSASR